MRTFKHLALITPLLSLLSVNWCLAEQPTLQTSSPETKTDLKSIKKQFMGEEDAVEYRVVQNRFYKKENRVELSFQYGTISGDPFLKISEMGGSLGFHVSEYLSIHALYWKATAGDSSAMDTLVHETGTTANTNKLQSYSAGELRLSPVYGKLSIIGKKIIYYDLFLMGGAGKAKTETGSPLALHFGIGQQFFLNQNISLQLSYRLMRYNETVVNHSNPNDPIARSNTSGVVSFGLSFQFP